MPLPVEPEPGPAATFCSTSVSVPGPASTVPVAAKTRLGPDVGTGTDCAGAGEVAPKSPEPVTAVKMSSLGPLPSDTLPEIVPAFTKLLPPNAGDSKATRPVINPVFVNKTLPPP